MTAIIAIVLQFWPLILAAEAALVGALLGHKIGKASVPAPVVPVITAQQQAATDSSAVSTATAETAHAMDVAGAQAPTTQAAVVDSLTKGTF